MALSQMEPQNPSYPPKFNHFIGESYELSLTQSIQTFLDSHNKPTTDFSELMQARANPPLESIWVYSALTFRSNNSPESELLNRLSVTKALFQSISACSAPCSSSKSVALLAPVVYELCRLIVDLRGQDLGFKKEKKVNREIKSLVDVILGYISVCCCCCKGWDDEDGLIQSLEDLVRVWIGENGRFKLFFPLVSDEIIERRISHGGCEISELAGVVIAEAFLLRLCLDSRAGIARAELQKELRTWAVATITGFQNICFFEILVGMMLEPTLPVASLLNSEDESFLRRVLYDTVILVDYSYVHPERLVDLPAHRMKSLLISRLMVTHEATELFRKGGDQTKAISCINAFSSSHLPSQIVKWVSSEIGMEHKVSKPNGSSPKAFLTWLINLQNRGLKLFGDGISKLLAKLVLEVSKVDYEELASKAEENKSDPDLLFYIDNKGEEENENKDDDKNNESMNAAFVAAAQSMKSVKNGGERKRKEGGRIGKEKRVKFVKHNLYDNSGSSGEFSPLRKDGSSSESEVENPLSTEESE